MTYETILVNITEGVTTITLNRPGSLNAFNNQMIAETTAAFKEAGQEKGTRCIVITGNGRAFSSGQDLKDVSLRGENFSIGEHLRHGYNRLITQMISVEKPIIAAVNGVAAGAGFGVALAADLRIASEKATFIQAFSRIGLVPDSATTWTLPRLIGYTRAYEISITGDPVTAEQALKWGMVNRVAPAEQFMEIVLAWARRLAEGPTLAYGLTKRAMYRAEGMGLDDALAYEARVQEIAARSDDFREGVAAFLEKRAAHFKGR